MSPATAERLAELRATTNAGFAVIAYRDNGCFVIVTPDDDETPTFLMFIDSAPCRDRLH